MKLFYHAEKEKEEKFSKSDKKFFVDEKKFFFLNYYEL